MTDLNIPIPNLSLFSPNKFRVVIQKFPGLNFFAQKITMPAVTLGQTKVTTNKYLDFYIPGDKTVFDDLQISFLLDEDLVAYSQIKEWMVDASRTELLDEKFSDLQIVALTNNSNQNLRIHFQSTFPYYISPVPMDTTRDEQIPITIDVFFKYAEFNILTE
jgi:hypothetical protein